MLFKRKSLGEVEEEMITLLDFIDDAFKSYYWLRTRYESVQEFIGNNEKCLSLIYHFLDLGHDDMTVLNKSNFNRASHIVITYLIGLGIEKKTKMIAGANKFNSLPDEYLWMLTSLLHDYGYFRKELLSSKSLDDLKLKYDLLTDDYTEEAIDCLNDYSINNAEYCTFSYETIKNYYEYKREYTSLHGSDENSELNDHGIMGACLAFSQYINFYIKYEYPRIYWDENDSRRKLQRTEPLLYKTACLVAAQHNLFKSGSASSDVIYQKYNLSALLSTAPVQIDKKNPLLLLLSIVDTVECSKRFSKKTNPKKYLETMTILKNISIEVNEDSIIVDFTNLHIFITKRKDNKELIEQLKKHINNIICIDTWTSYQGELIEPYKISIQEQKDYI